MPDVKVYIRTEDLDTWNSIEKKSEFMHRALTTLNDATVGDIITRVEQSIHAEKVVESPKLKALLDLGPPKEADLQMACCLDKKNKCKHWSFDGVKQAWTNTRSGEVVGVDF